MGGSAIENQPSVYGTQGVAAPGNTPGALASGTCWTDAAGNFWLLAQNDLWRFDPSTKEWTWIKGTGGGGLNGVYGTLGVPVAENMPGARSNGLSWTDSQGDLWLFGGDGYASNGGPSELDDLWRFSPRTGEWTWMAGHNTLDQCGFSAHSLEPWYCPHGGAYGTLGQPAAENLPGGRHGAVVWTDKNGNVWSFGGIGATEPLQPKPGARNVNELWEYVPSTRAWGWMGGCSSTPSSDPCPTGVYGELGKTAPTNIPGARFGSAGWTGSSGALWLFGGAGYDSSGNQGILNDLWKLDPSTAQWTWMGGSSRLTCSTNENGVTACAGQRGVYGTIGVPSSTNQPGARNSAMAWTDSDGNFWLFGGNGYDAAGNLGELNDIWVLNSATLQWAWMAGSSTIDCVPIGSNFRCGKPGVYGQLGIAGAENTPGGRDSSVGWIDRGGSFWLFGGNGYDSLSRYPSWLNDLWEYRAQAPVFPTAAPTFSVPGGTYTSTQTVTIADVMPEAAIYYTTDGSMPTTASTVYTSAIAVSKTETIQAMAIAAGYPASEITNATYTIKLPATFTMGSSVTSMTLNSGSSGVSTLTITPQNGFESTVSFACSGLPAGASCSFSPATVTPSGSAVGTTMTITTAKKSASLMQLDKTAMPIAAFAVMLGIFGIRRSRPRGLLLIAIAMAGLGLLSACGGGGTTAGGSPPVTYTTTVTAASGSLQQTATIALTVN